MEQILLTYKIEFLTIYHLSKRLGSNDKAKGIRGDNRVLPGGVRRVNVGHFTSLQVCKSWNSHETSTLGLYWSFWGGLHRRTHCQISMGVDAPLATPLMAPLGICKGCILHTSEKTHWKKRKKEKVHASHTEWQNKTEKPFTTSKVKVKQ